jgi:Tfp pilus assembly protein PilF
LDEGQINNAIANLNRAIKIDSSLWISHYYRGICHKKMRLFDLSDQDFIAAIAFNSKAAEPHIELAENYIANDKFKEASSQLDAAIELNPTLPQSYHNLAAIAFLEGNIMKATRLYKKANDVGPKYPDAYLMQGVLSMVQKGPKKGIEFISKSIQVDSSYTTGYFWRGLVLLEEGKTEECLKDWNKLIQYDPENPMYVMMRGYLYIELKQFDKAFVDFKKALKAQEVDQDKFAAKQSILDKQIDLHAAANYLIANGYGLDETAFAFLRLKVSHTLKTFSHLQRFIF